MPVGPLISCRESCCEPRCFLAACAIKTSVVLTGINAPFGLRAHRWLCTGGIMLISRAKAIEHFCRCFEESLGLWFTRSALRLAARGGSGRHHVVRRALGHRHRYAAG